MKVWITKYALTRGLFEAETDPTHTASMRLVRGAPAREMYVQASDWRMTLSDAIDRADNMRKAKINSLREKIAALEAMDFNATAKPMP